MSRMLTKGRRSRNNEFNGLRVRRRRRSFHRRLRRVFVLSRKENGWEPRGGGAYSSRFLDFDSLTRNYAL